MKIFVCAVDRGGWQLTGICGATTKKGGKGGVHAEFFQHGSTTAPVLPAAGLAQPSTSTAFFKGRRCCCHNVIAQQGR